MGALFKSSIFLALAIAIGVYLYLSLSDDDVASVPPEASVASVAAAPEAAQADIDDDLVDYLAARQIGSLEGWRAFLTAHGSGLHAQLARAEVEKLLPAEKTPPAAIAEVSHRASPDGQAANEADPATPSAGTQVAAATPEDVCKRDEERLQRLRGNPSSDEAARFANELSCENLRPQLLALIEDLGGSAPAAAGIGVANGEASDTRATNEADPATPSADTQVATPTPDDVCRRDEERLERLRKSPSSEEAARFVNELSCEKLRPRLLVLIEDLGRSAPAAAAIGVANGEASDARAANEADPAATPSADTRVAAATPDDDCKRDEERLQRLRSNPSSDEAARFANELGCEKLRPQISRIAESFGYVAPTLISAAEGQLAKGSLAQGQKAGGDCAAERDRLDRLRAQPSADAAQQLWRDLRCERLRPQVRLLLESLNAAADPSGACRRETEELSRIRTNPNRREAEGFARDMTCEALRPQAARLLESLTD